MIGRGIDQSQRNDKQVAQLRQGARQGRAVVVSFFYFILFFHFLTHFITSLHFLILITSSAQLPSLVCYYTIIICLFGMRSE